MIASNGFFIRSLWIVANELDHQNSEVLLMDRHKITATGVEQTDFD